MGFKFIFNFILCTYCTYAQSDLDVLLTFRSSITQDPSNVLQTWTNNTPFCNWTGITCHPKHRNRIQSIDLHEQNLTGTISPMLGKLEYLDYLDLQSNDFSGNIPHELGNCTSLEQLALGPNPLSGPVPDMFHMLTKLRGLAIQASNLSGPIPQSLANCSSLQALSLHSNSLTGKIPDIFHRMENLSLLYLFKNSLGGPIPISVWNCSKMRDFELSWNSLTGELPQEVPQLPVNLLYFYVYLNQIGGHVPSWLANCTNLQELSLSWNHFQGVIPSGIGIQSQLYTILDFAGNSLTGPIPPSVGNCSSLIRLLLNDNSLEGSVPPEIGNLQKLKYIYLDSNKLSGNIPSTVGNASSLSQLMLHSNQLEGRIPVSLGSLPAIERLVFSFNMLSGNIPTSLVHCKTLGILALSNNMLEGYIPHELGQIQSLSKLDLGVNRLHGQIPSGLGSLSRLQYLDLSHNKLNGTLPSSLASLGSSLVFVFDISDNDLQGTIPLWIGNFDKVVNISLSSNNLSGEIPAALGGCNGVMQLNLSNNMLTGTIPSALIQLRSLESLDLSINALTGRIPAELTTLDNLKFVNLSYNQLEGPVPMNGSFSKLNSSSFQGNQLLCGSILTGNCSSPPLTNPQNKKKKMVKWLVPVSVTTSILICAALCICAYGVHLRRTQRNAVRSVGIDGLSPFSFDELSDMTESFSDATLVGKGGYSKVYRGKWKDKQVAVKVLQDISQRESFLTEVKTLASLRHRNITKVVGYCCSDKLIALVMEFMSSGSLASYLNGRNALGVDIKLKIAIDIAQGVHYLHNHFDTPVVHGDLKPENVLLDSDFTAHLGDFGLSKLVSGKDNLVSVSGFRGTIGYAPPEYASALHISTMGDVYSFGMLLLVLGSEKSPTNELFRQSESSLRVWISQNLEIYNEFRILRLLIQVGLLCTLPNPSGRPNIQEALAMVLEISQGRLDYSNNPSLETLANE